MKRGRGGCEEGPGGCYVKRERGSEEVYRIGV